MKKIILSLVIAAFGCIAHAQTPAAEAKVGDVYGEKMKTTDGALELADVAAKLNNSNNSNSGALGQSVTQDFSDIKIRAKIVEACAKKGCWAELEIDEKTTVLLKMMDDDIIIPLAAKGKTVVVDGDVSLRKMSVAEQKQLAKDAKKPQEEIDAITNVLFKVQVIAKGIVIVE